MTLESLGLRGHLAHDPAMFPDWLAVQPQDVALSFLSILLEGLPFVLLGTLISGMVDQFLPARWMDRWLPKNPHLAVLVAGGCGVIFPMCECGVVPVIRRLMAKGLPVSCAVTYMLAAPILNPVTALSTWAAFRGQSPEIMTFLRLALGYAIPVAVGWIILKVPAEQLLRGAVLNEIALRPGLGAHGSAGPFLARLRRALLTSGRDFATVACLLVLGALLTAIFNTSVPQDRVKFLAERDVWAVPSMMGLAYVLALCSSSDAFIAATFFAFPPAARLAFLVFGPMVDIKLTLLYATTFRKRFVFLLGAGLFVAVGLLCLRAGRVLW